MFITKTLHCTRVSGNNDLLLIDYLPMIVIETFIAFLDPNFITYIEILTQVLFKSIWGFLFTLFNTYVVRVWHYIPMHSFWEPLLPPHNIATTTLLSYHDPLNHPSYLAVPVHHVHRLVKVLPATSTHSDFKLFPLIVTLSDLIDSVFNKHAVPYLLIYSIWSWQLLELVILGRCLNLLVINEVADWGRF